jgi:hypothetical protein
MANKAKENAQSGMMHWAAKLLNNEGQFEKNLKSYNEDIKKQAAQLKSFEPIDVSNVVNTFDELIKKREAFTKAKNSKNENEIEQARVAAQQAVQNAAGSGSGGLNALIAKTFTDIADTKRACDNNVSVLDQMSQSLTSCRTEITRKNDKDGKAYGKNYAKPMGS